jgi:HSP20 family molecular chaperone IbpA
MAGHLSPAPASRWSTLMDWLEDVTPELRLSPEAHLIRIEESEDDGVYVVRAELPGIDPDKDVDITFHDGVLTMHAKRGEEKLEKHRSEFRYGSFTRSVRLPAGVREQDITANYEHGVLTVKAPVGTEEKPAHRITIQHSEGSGDES